MSYKNLSNEVEIRKIANPDINDAASGDVTSSVVDVEGFDGVLFLSFVTAGNVGTYMDVEGDDTDGEQGDRLDGARALSRPDGTNVRDNIALAVDVYQPKQKYLRAKVTCGDDTAVGPVYAIKYKLRDKAANNYVNANGGIHTKFIASPDPA